MVHSSLYIYCCELYPPDKHTGMKVRKHLGTAVPQSITLKDIHAGFNSSNICEGEILHPAVHGLHLCSQPTFNRRVWGMQSSQRNGGLWDTCLLSTCSESNISFQASLGGRRRDTKYYFQTPSESYCLWSLPKNLPVGLCPPFVVPKQLLSMFS